MFTHRPVDGAVHLIVSVSVFKWCKCCASHNKMVYVSFCRTAQSALTVIWLPHYVPLITMCLSLVLDLARLLLTLILPRSRTGTVWFYNSTSKKRAARPKLYTKSLTGDLKLMYSRFTLVRISIKL